jgi:hypothetical protein
MHGMATENEGAREHHTHKRRLSREDEPILLDHLSFWLLSVGSVQDRVQIAPITPLRRDLP